MTQNSRLVYDSVDGFDTSTGLSVKMRTTPFPASTSYDGKGEVLTRGAAPQEIVIDPGNFVAEIERRDINISIWNI